MAKTGTYALIASTTLGTASNTITFSSIPSTYTDLVIVANIVSFSSGGNLLTLQFNSDTNTNYSGTGVVGTGTAAQSTRYTSFSGLGIGGYGNGTGTGQAVVISNIQDYANATTYKTVVSRFSSSSQQVDASVGMWRSTAAINSILFYVYGGVTTMGVGTVASLYGIQAGNA